MFEGKLFWVSQKNGQLITADKFGRKVNKTLQTGLVLPCGLKVFHVNRYDLASEISFSCNHDKSVRSWCDGSSDWSFMVDPLSYFSLQPVLDDWFNKGCGMCYPVHIKEPLLLIVCFCSFDLFCPILEKGNFIEHLYIVLSCLIKEHSFLTLFVSI